MRTAACERRLSAVDLSHPTIGVGVGWARRLRWVALVGSLTVTLAAGMVPIHAADYFTHLAMGRYVVDHGVPRTEPFLYPCQGRPLIAFEWLAGVLLYWGYQIWGHAGMLPAKAAAAAATFVLVFLTARQRGAMLAVAAAVTLWAVMAGQHRLLMRPHLPAWLIVAAVFYLLHLEWSWRRALPVLIVAAVLLANLHGSAVIAAGVVALFGLSCVVTPDRRRRDASEQRRRGWCLVLAAVLMIAASVVNPRAAALLTYPFRPADAADVRSTVEEWKPMPWLLDRWPFWSLAAAVLLGLIASIVVYRRRPSLLEVVLPVGLVVLSVWMRRFGLLMGVLCAPLLAAQLSELIGRWQQRGSRAARWVPAGLWSFWLLAAAGMMTLGGEVRRPGWGWARDLYPARAVDWIAGQPELRGPVFANYEFGGYLHWRLFPLGCQAIIDGRTWDYPRSLFEDYGRIMTRQPGWQARLDAYGAAIRLERWRPAQIGPGQDRYVSPGWVTVYWDDHDVVMVRDLPKFGSLIERYACGASFPPTVMTRLGRAGQREPTGAELTSLRASLEKRLAEQPDSAMTRIALGRVLGALGRTAEAAEVLDAITGFVGTRHQEWVWLCTAHLVSMRPDRAMDSARRYVALVKGDDAKRRALRLLVIAAQGAGDHASAREALDRYLKLGPPDKWSVRTQAILSAS